MELKVAVYMLVLDGFHRSELLKLYQYDIDFESQKEIAYKELLIFRGEDTIEGDVKLLEVIEMYPYQKNILNYYINTRNYKMKEDVFLEVLGMDKYLFKMPFGNNIKPD